MENIAICVSFITVILGIAYPILFQVIIRQDERYSSQIIIDLFNRELEKKFFIWSLISSLVCLAIFMAGFPPLISIQGLDYVISNSAELLLVTFTIILVISFIFFVSKILLYYNTRKFVPYLIKKHNTRKILDNYDYFTALSDLLLFSIKHHNITIAKTISYFMYSAFKSFRDIAVNKEVEYPSTFYNMVYYTIEELAGQRNKRLSYLEHRTAGGIWLLGEFGNSKLSETTYAWMYRNLELSLKYDRGDFVVAHWQHAHQYINYTLKPISPDYTYEEGISIRNKAEVHARNEERSKFLEFHYALGGLLLYKHQYNTIHKAFTYTQSIPPTYELLPQSIDDVFYWFFRFRDPYEVNFTWITTKYYLPDVGGMDAGGVVKQWICQYITLLFLRQYTVVPYYVHMEPLRMPTLPEKQSEKRLWLDSLPFFKKCLEEILENEELLLRVGFNHITDKWCKANKYPTPMEYVDRLQKALEASFDQTLVGQEVAPGRVQKFMNASKEILLPVLKEVQKVGNENELTGELNKRYVHGERHLFDKSAFAENQEAEHINFYTILAESLSDKIKNGVSEVYYQAASKHYLLKEDDIAAAIQKLNIDNKSYVIVSFGIQVNTIKPASLTNIDILEFPYRNYALVGDSLFILKKEDLIRLNFIPPSDEDKMKYSLNPVITEYHLYGGVVDLNIKDDLRESVNQPDQDLRKSVIASLYLKVELQWKVGMTCIHIEKSSAFRQKGLINTLTDIEPIPDNIPPKDK